MEFERALQVLCDAGVEFVVIGGLCGVLHGASRITYDLDICYARSPLNISRLAHALAPFHPRLRDLPDNLPFIWDERTLKNGNLFTLNTDLGPIDLAAEVAGVGTYERAKECATSVEAFERKIAILDLRSLIQAKRAAGRQKDIEALVELESLLEAEDGD
jgi:hypothetical protein